MNGFNCMDCKDELNLCKLCVKRASIEWLHAHSICTDSLEANHLKLKYLSLENACISLGLKAKKVEAEMLNTNVLCARTGTINSLCVNNLKVNSLDHCVKYRASVTLSALTPYTLGNNIDWDFIIDDPNGNVSFGPFKYTVPVTGYYSFDYHLNTSLISGTTLISGTPIGLLTILVNGVKYVDDQVVYLSFSVVQSCNMAGLIILNAGDIVQMKYEILILDASSGLVSYNGTTVLQGSGVIAGQSYFNIHYLSSLNCSSTQCAECPTVTVLCSDNQMCEVATPISRRPSPVDGMRESCSSCQ